MPGFRPSQGVLASPVQVAIDALLRRPVASEAVPADAPAAQWHRPASAACARSAGIRLGQRARRDAASTDSASDVQGGGATGAAGAECCGSSSGSMLDAADVDEIPPTPDSVADEYALVPFEDYGGEPPQQPPPARSGEPRTKKTRRSGAGRKALHFGKMIHCELGPSAQDNWHFHSYTGCEKDVDTNVFAKGQYGSAAMEAQKMKRCLVEGDAVASSRVYCGKCRSKCPKREKFTKMRSETAKKVQAWGCYLPRDMPEFVIVREENGVKHVGGESQRNVRKQIRTISAQHVDTKEDPSAIVADLMADPSVPDSHIPSETRLNRDRSNKTSLGQSLANAGDSLDALDRLCAAWAMHDD